MDIKAIKATLGVATLEMNVATKDGVATDWLRHWDNNNRVAVSMHKELFAELVADKAGVITNLALQRETRDAAQGEYEALRIVRYTPATHTI